MNRRKTLVMLGLAALVAGAAALVYAEGDKGTGGGETPQVLYDFDSLPDPVKAMIEKIAAAAQSGDIDKMRPVLEANELKPMVAAKDVGDPIAYWKRQSPDGTGRDVLAALLNALASGYVKTGTGHDEMFVWPYFAEIDLAKLNPSQEVELYRIVPAEQAATMKKDGKYTGYRLGVSASGVWHYFLQ